MNSVRTLRYGLILPTLVMACSDGAPTDPGFNGGSSSGNAAAASSGTGGGGSRPNPTTASSSASDASGSASGAPASSGVSSGTVAGGSAGNGGSAGGSSGAPSDGGASGGPTGGTKTIQTVDIAVPAGAELVKCQNFANPFGQDVALLETDSTMVSSHHMFVFHDPSFNQDTNSVADCSGIEFHDLLHLAQTPSQSIVYPAGVGRSLKANEGLRILVHLLNTTAQPVTAHVTIDMRWVMPNQVQSLAVALFLNNALLSVPPGMSTQSRTFNVPADIKVMAAVSHMHSRATNFSATTNTGTVLYKGTDWNEPVPTRFNPDLPISAGSTITWACTYNNTTGMTLTFGESAKSNEMCILAGIAYPAQPGVALGQSLEWVL